ncbi:MAG: hypothetical protein Q8M83_04415 [bacterium]|nr:hypothetical protein [bacterium]
MSAKSSEALNHSPEEVKETAVGDESLFKGQEDLIAEGDEVLGVKSVEEERAIKEADKKRQLELEKATTREEVKDIESGLGAGVEKKQKEAAFRDCYNYIYTYHKLSQKVAFDGKAELNEIGKDLAQEKNFLINVGVDLAEEAGMEIASSRELSLLPLGGKGNLKLDKALRQELREHNEVVKEFWLKEKVFKDLWVDVKELKAKKAKITPDLLLRRGLNHIEKGLARDWQAKGADARKEELRAKTKAYNELSKVLPELKFTALEKNYAQTGILLQVELEEKPVLAKKTKREGAANVNIAPEYQKAIADYKVEKTQAQIEEEQEVKRLAQLKAKALEQTQDEDVRDIIVDFNPETYARTKTKFLAVQKDLMDLGALPGGGLGNTLKMLFKYPARFGEFRALKAKYDDLSRELKQQDQVLESYLDVWEKSDQPVELKEKAKESPTAFSRVKGREVRKLQEQVLLAPYREDVVRMSRQLLEIKNAYQDLAQEIDFTPEEYWLDYDRMMKLQDQLEKECGFSLVAGKTSNRLKAKWRGKADVYKKLKSEYDEVVRSLQEKDKFFESYGALGAKLTVKKKERVKREGDITERLKKSV